MTLRFDTCFRAFIACALIGSAVQAQIPGGGAPPAGRYPVAQADFQGPTGPTKASQTMVDAYGNPAILPVQYCESCPPMGGGYGYPPCGDGMPDAFGGLSLQPDQCGPHYFDFAAEAIYYKRDKLGDRVINFTSANIGGPIVLSTGSVEPAPADFLVQGEIENEFEPGFRLTGRIDIGALSVFEASYTGLFELDSTASVTDLNPDTPTDGNLFTLFSLFGLDPAGGIGMPETEQGVFNQVQFESDLQTAELSYRRYWVGYNPRVSGTILTGFRYTDLYESLSFFTQANGTFNLSTTADNDLVGFQLGGDVWYTVLQGLRVGTEGKIGIYNNWYKVRNLGVSSDGSPSVNQLFEDSQVAFIGEQRASIVADILPNWSLKAGVEVLYINSIVTAVDNFPTGSPYPGLGPQIPPFLNDQSHALYYGFHAGVEYVW